MEEVLTRARFADLAAGVEEQGMTATVPRREIEDAVQAASALKIGADYLVTRNEKDFRSAPVPTAAPATVLALL
jgi:predicted nucleic acid-binding protein